MTQFAAADIQYADHSVPKKKLKCGRTLEDLTGGMLHNKDNFSLLFFLSHVSCKCSQGCM